MTTIEQWGDIGMGAALIGACLTLYGLRRGSAAALALAAAGGYLAYRGLRQTGWHRRWQSATVPPADSPVADRFLCDVLENRT